ncbi:MAG: hypothetical protein WEC34_06200, partial [Acidimicrobiia bacterium]
MVAGVAVGVVGVVLLIVAVQSPAAWKAAADHSKRFWFLWALVLITAGLAPVAFTDEVPTGGALAWLVVCCVLAALQPSLFADVLG